MQYTETVTIIIHSLLVHMLDQRTKSFCFGKWDGIGLCVPQFCYQQSATWRWKKVGDNYQIGKCSLKISHQPPFDGV